MAYSIRHVKKTEQTTSLWSGGKTTQLGIFPEGAGYGKRNFKWRVSTADVEVEESLFTHLPGIQRIIMVLDGKMYLEHEGKHSVLLQLFEQDRFDGGWTTRSKGRVTDFNLMLADGVTGEVSAVNINNENSGLRLVANGTAEVFYCVEGTVKVAVDERDSIFIEKGDTLILQKEIVSDIMNIILENEGELSATMVRTRIHEFS